MSQILVVASHPDDEILGCGGTIARHSAFGDSVQVLFVADGISSRGGEFNLEHHREISEVANRLVGAKSPIFLDFPDNQLDSLPLLEIVRSIEDQIERISPTTVYTHFSGDLNIDHSIVNRAVLTACRPQPNSSVREIYSFEVPSSTGWFPTGGGCHAFEPRLFVDISNTLQDKLAALKVYSEEMRPFPHSRSYENIEHLARYRGASVGLKAAEGFVVERILHSN